MANINGIFGNDNGIDSPIILGTTFDDFIFADGGNDIVEAGAGNDTLDGGTGNDTLVGGIGDDTYFIDSTSDRIIENSNEGIDSVFSSVSILLDSTSQPIAYVENLTLTGSSDLYVVGNNLDNTIIGNDGNNYIDGGHGNDSLYGEEGDDTLLGYSGNDYLNSSNGNDYVNSGLGNDTLTGGAGNDRLESDGGNDTLIGGFANDTLVGGASADLFIFYSPWSGIDTITDFAGEQGDKLIVSASGFAGGLALGTLSSEQFTIGSAAADASDRFIYDSSTGQLFFDADGIGAIEQVQFATLSPELNPIGSDIYVIA